MSEDRVEHQVEILRSEVDWRKRNVAIDALATIHTNEAFQAIVRALDDENPYVVSHAIRAMGQFGLQAVPVLIEALSKPDQIPLLDIVQVLRNLHDQRAIPALKQLLEGPDEQTALQALNVILDLMDQEDARQFAIAGLNDKRHLFQRQFARVAARMGVVEAIPILYEELTEPAGPYSYVDRKYPALALAALGELALEHLLKASHHEDEGTREAAAEGLVLISGSRSTARLIEMMNDPDPAVQRLLGVNFARKP